MKQHPLVTKLKQQVHNISQDRQRIVPFITPGLVHMTLFIIPDHLLTVLFTTLDRRHLVIQVSRAVARRLRVGSDLLPATGLARRRANTTVSTRGASRMIYCAIR